MTSILILVWETGVGASFQFLLLAWNDWDIGVPMVKGLEMLGFRPCLTKVSLLASCFLSENLTSALCDGQ